MEVANTYVPGISCHPEASAEFMAVLVEHANQYAVYVALVPKGTATDDERRASAALWVARCGVKQTYRKATAYFPALKEEQYRA
jgi:hypothetical protein